MKEVLDFPDIDAIMYTDSKSLYDCVESTSVIKDMRMFINVASLRSMKEKNSANFKWIEGNLMAADAITKHSASKDHILRLMKQSQLSFTPQF